MSKVGHILRHWENLPNESWDRYIMSIAKVVAKNSKCFSRQIGAVLVKDKSIIATGYNGPPRGVSSCDTRVTKRCTADSDANIFFPCPRYALGYKSGEGLHLCIAGHAERNAIINAARLGIRTFGTSLVCYCGIPCKDCMVEIINAGIVEVVYKMDGGTGNFGDYYDELSKYLVEESNLIVRGIEYE